LRAFFADASWNNVPLPLAGLSRKKGLLTVNSSGCTAFGHPAAHPGSLPDNEGTGFWAVQQSQRSACRDVSIHRAEPL
jgi:hypothetical protein